MQHGEGFCEQRRLAFCGACRLKARVPETGTRGETHVMHKGAACVAPDTLVSAIAKQMRDADVGALPVKAEGLLVGIVPDRDITCRALADGKGSRLPE